MIRKGSEFMHSGVRDVEPAYAVVQKRWQSWELTPVYFHMIFCECQITMSRMYVSTQCDLRYSLGDLPLLGMPSAGQIILPQRIRSMRGYGCARREDERQVDEPARTDHARHHFQHLLRRIEFCLFPTILPILQYGERKNPYLDTLSHF